MFERLFHAGGCKVIVLSQQYRMRQQLWSWPNDAFYLGGVETAKSAESRYPVLGLPWHTPLAFVDVQSREERPLNGRSVLNKLEARLVVHLVRRAIRGGYVSSQGIAIHTPYAAQCAYITRLVALDDSLSGVTVRDKRCGTMGP